jgi:integrase
MPRLTRKHPSYRKHKASGNAVVTLDGKDHYLGPHGTPGSRDAYDKAVSEWLARGRARAPVAEAKPSTGATVSECILAFWNHAKAHYTDPDGRPTGELDNIRDAVRPLRKLYGKTPAREFGPLALTAVRDDMVRSGTLARGTVNARIGRIRRLFRWAASRELIPATVPSALATVDALKRGRTAAHETDPVKPAPTGDIEAALPYMTQPVAAMVRLQLWTGCRPGEIVLMRGRDLTAGPETWEYRPRRHKNTWRGSERVIVLGPHAVALVKGFLRHDTSAPLFRPDRSRVGRYTVYTYRQNIERACKRAGVSVWSPLQLRHNAATEIRARFGLEAAAAVLGHSRLQVTTRYAELSIGRARDAMKEIG